MSEEKNKIDYSQLSKEQQKKLRSDRRKGNIIKAIINLPKFIGSKAKKVVDSGNVAESIIPKGEGKRVTKKNLKKVVTTVADFIRDSKKNASKSNEKFQKGGKVEKQEDVSKTVKELMSKIGKTSGKLSKAQSISEAFAKSPKRTTTNLKRK